MPAKSAPPVFNEERFDCPHCDAFAHQLWSELKIESRGWAQGGYAAQAGRFSDSKDAYRTTPAGLMAYDKEAMPGWSASTCSSCFRSSVWRGDRLIFPAHSSAPPPHADMPEAALTLYEEAREVLPISKRAAAALARAALERALREILAEPKKKLDPLIGDLAGKVSAPLWEVLTALRYLGNVSLHGTDDESELIVLYLEGDASKVVEPFFGAINGVVEELVAVPARSRELYEMIPDTVRADAERKAGKTRS
jgi:Domain of unknown function (DUF4145)